MRRLALIVIIRQNLPIILPLRLPRMIKLVVREIKVLESWLQINILEVILPRDLRLLPAIQVHPDKPIVVNVYVNREEPVLGLVEAVDVLVAWGFGKLAIKTVGPAVVLAGEDARGAGFLGDDGEGAMAADVVESVDLALAVFYEDEWVASDLVLYPVTCVGEAQDVGGQ